MAVKEPGSNSPLTERRISLLPGPNENRNSRQFLAFSEVNCIFILQTFEISNRIDKAFKCDSYWLPLCQATMKGNRTLSFF